MGILIRSLEASIKERRLSWSVSNMSGREVEGWMDGIQAPPGLNEGNGRQRPW